MDSPRRPNPRIARTPDEFRRAFEDNLYYVRGQAKYTASAHDAYTALAYTVRDYLTDRWRRTVDSYFAHNPRFVVYLSAEYLPGRQLAQNLLYSGTTDLAREALAQLDLKLDTLLELEPEPGLGNGGLGRLAACFIDSLATLDIPAIAYGIRYEYGIFRQTFHDGWQVEGPDKWLHHGDPWEFPQPDDVAAVHFGGRTAAYTDDQGRYRVRWHPAQTVLAEPCHRLVPGFNTGSVNLLRLWRARASEEFDFELFDDGDYARAVEQKVLSETISKVLYPNDNTPQGRELRLKQQYFFVAASLRDIVRRFLSFNDGLATLPDKIVIQLNDTHPVIAIPELMRVFVDEHEMAWDTAWELTRRTFAYTCHTLLPEALEKWPVALFEYLLPRHLEIIYEINRRFLDQVRAAHPHDAGRIARLSIIEEGPVRQVRMANLATIGTFSVNGVADLHSRLLREHTLRDFAALWPTKFNNKTNGVTPRRFIRLANPTLSALITSRLGDGWLTELERLRDLEPLADDPEFQAAWRDAKQTNKRLLADAAHRLTGATIDPAAAFDVMVKRLHEYKRQLLKALHIVTLYRRLGDGRLGDLPPLTFLFGAKAAPGYAAAKLVIKLINSIAATINADRRARGRLAVLFFPNFNVSLGERIYPAADISQQISLAGKEASGTGNMKFALNGAITTGTLDGANIEIRQLVGADNFFEFGLDAGQVIQLKAAGYHPRAYYDRNPELQAALAMIADGTFCPGQRALFQPLVDSLLNHDEYLLLADYESYIDCQERAATAYRDQPRWTRMSILNVARCGFFSSDRAIRDYLADIWHADPLPVAPG